VSRTTAPYDVQQALGTLSDTVDAIDTDQLARAFDTLASTFAGTPADLRASVTGLSRLSTTIASRDNQLRTLLARTRSVSGVLAARNGDISALLADPSPQDAVRRGAERFTWEANSAALFDHLTGLVDHFL